MKRFITALAAVAFIFCSAPAERAQAQADVSADFGAIQTLQEDVAIAAVLTELNAAPVPDVTIIRNVRVVDPVEGTATPNLSVIVAEGRFVRVVPIEQEPSVPNATIIDGGGHFMSPGLVDMHVHSHWASAWLLDLANGVTTVREMDGFPWMLDVRARAAEGRMLAPSLYVAGTIINGFAMGGYAVTPRDAADARRIVRQQAACGYDFIKIHNVVPPAIFEAVVEESARVGMDLVGHVPHAMRVRYAVEHGLRTMEHLKGFLDDRTLQMGDTDYAAAANANVWVTPTLYSGRSFVSAEEQRVIAEAPEMRYVQARRRRVWAAEAEHPDELFALNVQGQVFRREITQRLAVTPGVQFLAGTDAAFYTYGVMGFALVEELQLLQQNGLTPLMAMRAATSAPAEAMRAQDGYGRIQRGLRADFVLLDANPLESAAAYRSNLGVMVRGRWLDRTTLHRALARLAEIYARPDLERPISRAEARALATRARELSASGFVFSAPILVQGAEALRGAGHGESADAIAALANAPTSGVCAAPLPS